jgi:large subunit ribosomal protein L21
VRYNHCMQGGQKPEKYAVIQSGNKQYLVEEGQILALDRLENKSTITFDEILFVVDGDRIEIGTPYVKGAKVKAKVVGHFKGPKIKGFKFTYKMKYGKRYGHRQPLTRIEVEEISLKGEQ